MNKSIDEQFIEYIVTSLVGKPEAVQITRTIDEKGVLLELTVDPEDLGRVIGKRGATAQSLRTLLRALGTKNDARYNLKIIDNGVPREEREQREPAAVSDVDNNIGSSDGSGWAASPAASATVAATEDTSLAAEAEAEEEEDHNSVLSKTRKELEDLDDLDV